MDWLIRFIKKLFKVESKQEYANKLTLSFLKQFNLNSNDREDYTFFYAVFLEWGKTKNGIKDLYKFLNDSFLVFVKLLKAEKNTLKSLDPDAYTETPDKKHILKLMESVISVSKTKENFRKIVDVLSKEQMLNNSVPSVIIRFLIPIVMENIRNLNIEEDIPKFANIIDFYRSTVNKEILLFLENVFRTYVEIRIKFKNIDIDLFGIKTIQDLISFIEIFKNDEETVKTFIKYVFSAYLIFHVNNYQNYSEEFKEYFATLLENLKTRYGNDEALLQSVLMDLNTILKLSSSLNDITTFVQTLDAYIVDFIEIAKTDQVIARLKQNNMFFYASRKIKKDIHDAEALLIHYTAYAMPSLMEACANPELFEFARALVKELMSTFNDIEIGFYYAYVVLPKWLKANKDKDATFDRHERLKKLLYPMQKDMNELVRFFYFDFKDYMV